MDIFNSYGFIIAACLIIIISYFFNQIARKTNIPSVLLLIILGILLNQANEFTGAFPDLNLFPILEVLGIVGLIMIVLEASLELKLGKDKVGLILKSLLIAFVSLVVNAFLIAWAIKLFWSTDWFISLIYAVPLSIISSAIIIPSVVTLPENKKEFLTYESTFSDILGIMFFFFMIQAGDNHGNNLALTISSSIIITIVVSIVSAYGLIFLFQKLTGGTKLFLLIAVLVLLFSAGKLLHLSSLLLILVFGLVLSNYEIFTGGKVRKYFNHDSIKKIYDDFLLITLESSFIIRTFFFLVFGLSIGIKSLADSNVIMVSLAILSIIFISRYILLYAFYRKASFPQWQIAPRGLITILLFFGIPEEYQSEGYLEFEGVLLFVILFSSLIMAVSMISFKKRKLLNHEPVLENGNKVTEMLSGEEGEKQITDEPDEEAYNSKQ